MPLGTSLPSPPQGERDIGGSLGGLLAAHLLRRSGWHAVVFERENDLTGRGVGLGTHPQLIAVLRRAGIAFDAAWV